MCADLKERMRDFKNENPVRLLTNFNIHFLNGTFPSCLKREKLKNRSKEKTMLHTRRTFIVKSGKWNAAISSVRVIDFNSCMTQTELSRNR